MSRIEKAIEKAVSLRNNKPSEPRLEEAESPHAANGPVERAEGIRFELKSSDVDAHLIALTEPFSPAAEEYRKLNSFLLRVNKTRKPSIHVIAITSSIGSEGKSITAANLAVTMAKDHEHAVLLIDADLRRPTLHKLFNITVEFGLSECINDGIDVGKAAVRIDGELMFIAAGRQTGKPKGSFSTSKLADVVECAKKRYPSSLVIIDTPPLLPFAETRALCSHADGVIFVVKDDMATMHNVTESMEILHDSNVLGIVYNAVSMESLTSSYRYDYYQNYSKMNREN